MSDLDQNSIAIRSVMFGHIGVLRDELDTLEARNGLRPPISPTEHALRINESAGALCLAARMGSDTTGPAMTVAANALALLEYLTDLERRS